MKKRWFLLVFLVIILLGGGVLVVWKILQKKNSTSQPNLSNSPLNGLSDQELKKCLLENFSRRLELEKYFVFNLGEEVKTAKQEKTGFENSRFVTSRLSQDLTKLTSQYEKKLEANGCGIALNKNAGERWCGGRVKKERISFMGSRVNEYEKKEYWGDKLDEKITNGKNTYIVFEKDNEFAGTFFREWEVDEQGKVWYYYEYAIRLRMNAPTTHICESKEKALEILKTDPALAGKV